jgi:hypothetical protein
MNSKIQEAIASFAIIQKTANACRLRVEIAPGTDAVHQMLEGIVQDCVKQIAALTPLAQSGTPSAAMLPAMKAVLSRYPESIGARVSFFEAEQGTKTTTGIPVHQPLQEQVDWCMRKNGTQIALFVQFEDKPSIVESFPAQQLTGPNLTS